MYIKDIKQCKAITAGDNTNLRELLNPLKDDLKLGYSLAHTKVEPGEITYRHKLMGSEVYYILTGEGEICIENEKEKVYPGQMIYIPPGLVQNIKNTGVKDLEFLCIVDPAWKQEDEEILE